MAQSITMPALSPTMTEGKLARWLKQEGDSVDIGDILAEIETDKATMEVEAVEEGRIGKIVVGDGTDNVPVNEVIGVLLEEGDDDSAIDQVLKGAGGAASGGGGEEAKADTGKAEATAEAKGSGGQKEAEKPAPAQSGSGSGTTPSVDSTGPAPPAPKTDSGERVFASPLARRLAKAKGLDLAQVKGSGPRGRIVRADVEAAEAPKAAPAKEAAPAAAEKPAAPAAPAQPTPAKQIADQMGMAYEEVSVSNMRKTIAQRLQESKQTIPHYYLTIDVNLDKLLKTRKELNDRGAGQYKLSVNDFLIRAIALALKQVPQANTAWNGSTMLQFKHADVAVAVATDGGLITPIIKKAETKGLADISAEMKDLAGRAREGKLKPEEYQGGTFSISNLGMFGIREFSAIINPPQSGILAVGNGEKRPIVQSDGTISSATMMTCTLSADHRTVDGAVGAQFLSAFRTAVEEPLSMLL